MLFYAFFESSKYKATPGKKIMNLYVATASNMKVSFFRSAYRFILLCIPSIPILIANFLYPAHEFWNYHSQTFQNITPTSIDAALVNIAATLLSIVLNLVWIIPIFFTKDRKCMHDMLTSTRVYTNFH